MVKLRRNIFIKSKKESHVSCDNSPVELREVQMPISNTDYFIKNVKKILERQHLSITELAKLSGISQGGLSDLLINEKGRSPSLEYAERIASALGYPLPVLLCDMEYPCTKVPMSDNIQCVVSILPSIRSGFVNLWHREFSDEFRKIEREYAIQRKLKS